MTSSLKDMLYEHVGRLAKGVANAKRLELIELLCQSPKSVEVLAAEASISVKLASAHLKELRLVHLVETDRQGRQIIYRLACPEVAGVLVSLRALAEHRLLELQHSMQQLADASDLWPAQDGAALWRKAKRGDVILIDVRPLEEYQQRHLPFARSIPLTDLNKQLKQLPKDKPVVAYCRGPFCSMSADAVNLLKKKGFNAYRWQEGAADWIADKSDMTEIRGST